MFQTIRLRMRCIVAFGNLQKCIIAVVLYSKAAQCIAPYKCIIFDSSRIVTGIRRKVQTKEIERERVKKARVVKTMERETIHSQ